MITLSQDKLVALNGIYDGAGLKSLFDVLEFIVVESENELIGTLPGDPIKISALHAVAHAQRALLTLAGEHVDRQVSQMRGREMTKMKDRAEVEEK